jgi:sulfide:quinone oxidoreductase
MNVKPISPILSVSEQIRPRDVATLCAAGFKSIICNRPDGEGPDQPDFSEIEAAAKAAGIAAAYLPVVPSQIRDEDAAAFGSLLDSLPKPVLAFCRTGARSTTLWSLSEGVRGRPLPEILTATK